MITFIELLYSTKRRCGCLIKTNVSKKARQQIKKKGCTGLIVKIQ